jgi:hypothetical protein
MRRAPTSIAVIAALVALGVAGRVDAQRGGAAPAPPPPAPRAGAPIDLTGYWVSIVTQDWRWRMVTPAKGDFGSIPINLAAKKMADAWDPARDEAAGEQCKAYGAAGLMAVPTRLRITWLDDNTLKVETDAGMQTRLFHFGTRRAPAGSATWQGDSTAEWLRPRPARGVPPRGGSLKVVTSRLRPGYLQKNGVPYSANAVMTEYWDLAPLPNGDPWITISSTVEDSTYLSEPLVAAFNFKKERDGAKWDPTPCSAR